LMLGVMLYSGIRGTDIIIKSGKITTQEAYKKSYIKWAIWGVIAWVIIIVCLVIIAVSKR
jgi:hypothetical protein